MQLPLEKIRVLDWSQYQAAPVASMMLADLGADVIKLEDPTTGEPGRGWMKVGGITVGLPLGHNFYFDYNNRNKRAIAVDVRKEEGRQVIFRLVEKSDIFIQNYRPGLATRRQVDYQTLRRFNPGLIYVNISGFGPKGGDAFDPGFDYLGQARSGILTMVSPGEEPVPAIPGAIADQLTGIIAAYACLVALIARDHFGVGQEVNVSLLGSMIWLEGLALALRLGLGKGWQTRERRKMGNPLWNHYRCGDGKWLALANPQFDVYWPKVCAALQIENLSPELQHARLENLKRCAEELIGVLDETFARKPREKWLKLLKESGIICCPVNNLEDVCSDPQAWANNYFVKFEHPVLGEIDTLGIPVDFSEMPGSLGRAAPELGQHTEQILTELLDYSWEYISQLKNQGAIG